ncbi:MAG TPA: aminotransferase class V-fold PLP-dependent enzyme [Polyangiaceae bacterium]|nr:aminotransferase class V-fold PLP-dependent enzyme [Polyangiaceae bacterium]
MSSPWLLDPDVVFLNHGSFGSCPEPVLAHQNELRRTLEREPVRFFLAELEERLDAAREALGALVGADGEDLVFVPNASFGVNSVLSSIRLGAGDEVVVTDHGYPACNNAAERWAGERGARVVVASVPFPIRAESDVTDAILAALTERTKLVLVDHVTSPTGLVFPVEAVVRAIEPLGVPVLVDGAHAPGMLSLDLKKLDATYYTGNLHKWICAPKGAAFLHVRRSAQAGVRPLVTSHGAKSTRGDRSKYRLEFDWIGTIDPTAYLSVPRAIEFVRSLHEDGLEGVMRDNRALALRARSLLAARLGVDVPSPDSMIGSLAALPIPDAAPDACSGPFGDALQETLVGKHRIQLPIFPWPRWPKRLIRVSAQRYNRLEQYERLADALTAELARSALSPRP